MGVEEKSCKYAFTKPFTQVVRLTLFYVSKSQKDTKFEQQGFHSFDCSSDHHKRAPGNNSLTDIQTFNLFFWGGFFSLLSWF